MSSASRSSSVSQRILLLEAQAELERAELAEQDREERKKNREKLIASRLKRDRLQLEIDNSSYAGSSTRSDVGQEEEHDSPRSPLPLNDSTAQVNEYIDHWRRGVDAHHEDGASARPAAGEPSGAPQAREVTFDLPMLTPEGGAKYRRPPGDHGETTPHRNLAEGAPTHSFLSTPMDPRATCFRPAHSTPAAPGDALGESSRLHASELAMLRVLDISQQEQTRRALLPSIKLMRFAGDMTKFSMFQRSFTWNVEKNTDDDSRKLTHLYDALDGTPKNLIASCLHLPPEVGYAQAWEILCKQYQNQEDLSEAFVRELLDWKEITAGDHEGLLNYAAYLRTVKAALGERYPRLELHETIRRIISKLPNQLRTRWVAKGDEHSFKLPALIDYVEKQARVVKNLGHFGCAAKTATEKGPRTPKARSLPVHHAGAVPPAPASKWCPLCSKAGHTLLKCRHFERLRVEDRWKTVSAAKYCFRCLQGPPHQYEKCDAAIVCGKCGSPSHHTLLHHARSSTDSTRGSGRTEGSEGAAKKTAPTVEAAAATSVAPKTGSTPPDSSEAHPIHAVSTMIKPDGRTMLKIIPVIVNGEHPTYAFIDGGAAPTLASKSLIKRLGLTGRPCNQTMITEAGTFVCKEVLPLSLGHVNGGYEEDVKDVFVTSQINVTTDHLMPSEWLTRWPYLSDVELNTLPEHHREVELIIGLNTTVNRVILDQRHGEADEPSAYLTRLGWVVFGPTGAGRESRPVHLHHVRPVDDTTELLQTHFNKDFWEKGSCTKLENSVEDERFLSMMKDSVQQVSGKYHAKLPLRDAAPLPNNRRLAERRSLSLKKKFEADAGYKTAYATQLQGYIDKGFAEEIPDAELARCDGKVNYLPHHGVLNPIKGKLRVVFDPKAKYANTSLNEHLLQGPDLTNSLMGVLLRFREGRLAMTADVEGMFHQVKVQAEDKDYFRFLWWPGGDTSKPLKEFRMTAHIFGARSSPSVVNFCLRQTAVDHGDSYDAEATHCIYRNFYVDNLLKSVDSPEEGIRLSSDLRKLCSDGGFRLNQWTSCSSTILETIPEEERDKSVVALDLNREELPTERALGIYWSMAADEFTFKTDMKDKPRTRRGALSIVASLYDPLGFVAPFTLLGKGILQDMCRRNASWDEVMTEEEGRRWDQWCEQFQHLDGFRLRRCYVPEDFGEVVTHQLHHFADASDFGYGVTTYLRSVNTDGRVFCALVVARARVAPLKKPTVPRLELTAASVAAQLDDKLRAELDIPLIDSVFWSDSTTVLKYLRNTVARYQTFVSNRVNLIREFTEVTSWRYVPTSDNPADIASRGCDIDALLSSIWLTGPKFLWEEEDRWPGLPADVRRGELDADAEVKTAAPVFEVATRPPDLVERVAANLSTWPKFLRVVGRLRRLATRQGGPVITVSELRQAEDFVWKTVQTREYSKEMQLLASKEAKVRKGSRIASLRPYLQDGLLRMGGRLAQSTLGEHTKHPLILPGSTPEVEMLVRWVHEIHGHCGQDYLLAELRKRYWIVHGNAIVRSVIRKCVLCKRLACRPIEQQMAELPSDRICPGDPPFTHTGCDCFGPFLVRRGRSTVKRWGAIFTCLTSRAIHLEVLDSMDQDSFVNAVRRFVARRGPVRRMWSDNGTNLVAAERELREALQQLKPDELTQILATKGIEWTFNPPHASHFGGVWERLIRSVRRALGAACLEQVTTDDTLATLFCEAESIVNGRPLTKVTSDPGSASPLTPSMLLTLKGSSGPCTATRKEDVYAVRRWRQAQLLADTFWKRWVREYLPLLQERQKWTTRRRDLQIGDLVLTLDERSERGTWPMGRVLEVERDSDGRVRKAKVKTEKGVYLRPVQKLCMLLESDSA